MQPESNIRRFFTPLFSTGILCVLLAGCASTPENPHFKTMETSEVHDIIAENTHNKKIYNGFMNTMDVSGTLQNEAVGRALLDQGARIYQWDAGQYADEKSKAESFRASKTEFFLSFFVPERKWDDLQKTKTTKWKIFLDVDGKRYEGEAKRWKANLSEVQSFYPHHTRWSTAYKLTFAVPTRIAESSIAKLTITGPVGVIQLDFEPASGSRIPLDSPSVDPNSPAQGESN